MREVYTPDPPNANSDNRCTILVVYEAVFGSCEFCEFAVISGYNSCQSSRKGYYVAGDISGCISDELALVWTQ